MNEAAPPHLPATSPDPACTCMRKLAHTLVIGLIASTTAINVLMTLAGKWNCALMAAFAGMWLLAFIGLSIARFFGLPIRWPWLTAYLAYAAVGFAVNAYLFAAISAAC